MLAVARATAEDVTDIRLRQPITGFALTLPNIESKQQVLADRLPSDNILNAISGPTLIASMWATAIERRIRESVPQNGIAQSSEDGEWLNPEIATQAIRFFKATSDVLPASVPYIYTSMNGDLVAEFQGIHGKLTSVIGKTAVIAFAVIHSHIVTTTVSLPLDNVIKVRKELQRITEQLRNGEHGTVEA